MALCTLALKLPKIIMIHKGGDKDNIDHFRPISLLITVSKILEIFVDEALRAYFEEFGVKSNLGFDQESQL